MPVEMEPGAIDPEGCTALLVVVVPMGADPGMSGDGIGLELPDEVEVGCPTLGGNGVVGAEVFWELAG